MRCEVSGIRCEVSGMRYQVNLEGNGCFVILSRILKLFFIEKFILIRNVGSLKMTRGLDWDLEYFK